LSTTLPGTATPFTTVGQNNSITGTWSYNGTTQEITIPMAGIYLIHYTIMVNNTNNSNQYRTMSSVIYINGSIVAGTGATTAISGTSISELVGNTILSLAANDLLIVYAISNGTGTNIAGISSIYVADNTSTTITITMLR